MLYFPQLTTGAIAQYPTGKRLISRSVVNDHADGTRWKLADAAAATTEWHLALSSLSDDEAGAIEALFRVVEGQWGTFTFLDPTSNLLTWSEKLTTTSWQGEPMLQVADGIADPWGGARATRVTNTGATAQRLAQKIDGPEWFTYCFSIYARSQGEGAMKVCRVAPEGGSSLEVRTGPAWRRIVWPTAGQGSGDGVTFGFELGTGAAVDVAGAQVEAQPGASPYKRTFSRGGVYARCRFAQDHLSFVTEGPGEHWCRLAVVALPEDRD